MRMDSSFETIESDFVQPDDTLLGSCEYPVVGGVGVVVIARSPSSDLDSVTSKDALLETGILILESMEEDVMRDASNRPRQPTITGSLSVPESIPSNIGSAYWFADPRHQPSMEERAKDSDSSSGQSIVELQDCSRVSVAGALQFVKARATILAFLLVFLAMALVPTMILVSERRELRQTTQRLEHKIVQLTHELEMNRKKQEDLYQKQIAAVLEQSLQQQQRLQQQQSIQGSCASSSTTQPSFLSFSSLSNVVDNCWVHAQANLELGHCAQEAKQKVKQGLANLGKNLSKLEGRFWAAQKEIKSHFREFKDRYEETGTIFSNYRWFTNQGPTEGDHHENDDSQHGVVLSQREDHTEKNTSTALSIVNQMHGLGKVATSVLTGVAAASAAALVVSVPFMFGDKED